MRITWRELAVDLSGQSSDELLSEWRWMVPDPFVLRMVSALGDAFLEDEAGRIYWLDVGAAEVSCIAESKDEFDVLRQKPENSNQWFIPKLVGDILASGTSLSPGQCFSFKIPPTIGGSFEPSNFEPCDLSVHFSTIGQIQKQVKHLPVGTKIGKVEVGE
jgi:hypothetical protein